MYIPINEISNSIFEHVMGLFPQEKPSDPFLLTLTPFITQLSITSERLDFDGLAHQACTSPLNDLPLPTEEEKETGNYKKGVIRLGNMVICIENPKGSIRRGNGWETVMQHHYGYMFDTLGADGDELDIFLKAGITQLTDTVYVIKQVDKNGKFDEHKVILGANSEEEAKEIYLSNYSKGWTGLGEIKAISLTEFQNKLGQVWTGLDDMYTGNKTHEITQENALNIIDSMLIDEKGILVSDKTTDQNYRWKDHGYVAGSKKELAQFFRNSKKTGAQVTLNSIDWDLLESDNRLAESLIVKENLIGKVDWLQFKESGMDSNVAYFIKKAYAQIAKTPTAPLDTESQKNYVSAISNFRENIEKCKTYEELREYLLDNLWATLRNLPPKILQTYFSFESDVARNALVERFPSLNSYDARVLAELGEGFYNWIIKSGGYALAEAKTGINAKTYTSSKGATWDWVGASKKPQQNDNKKPSKEKGNKFQLEHATHLERKGGKQLKIASSKELQTFLGLRAIQSGNYVLKDKASAEYHMQSTAEALSDLSDILQIPPQELGLRGNLALAFGARGKGGALAHYEPAQKVINLTKIKGGGSLSHELFHAIDNLINDLSTQKIGSAKFMATNDFSQIDDIELGTVFKNLNDALSYKNNLAEITVTKTKYERVVEYLNDDATKSLYSTKIVLDAPLPEFLEQLNIPFKEYNINQLNHITEAQLANIFIIRQHRHGDLNYDEKTGLFSVPIQGIKSKSEFLKNAEKLNEGLPKKYWQSTHEMAARAFTSYTIDKLAEQDRKNDYLSYEGNHQKVAFPQGEERKQINQAFDEVFKVIREKQLFKNASQNEMLLDDMFGGKSIIDDDHSAVFDINTTITQQNALHFLDLMQIGLLEKESRQDINHDNVDISDRNERTFISKFLNDELQYNQDVFLQLNAYVEANPTSPELDKLVDKVEAFLSENTTLPETKALLATFTQLEPKEKIKLGFYSIALENNIISHTTKKGKELSGIIVLNLSKDEAKELDPYTFRKNGGWFIRQHHILSIPDYSLDGTQNQFTKEALRYVSNSDQCMAHLESIRGQSGRSTAIESNTGTANGLVRPTIPTVNETGSNGNGSTSISESDDADLSGRRNSTDESGTRRNSTTNSTNDSQRSDTATTERSSIQRERDQSALSNANQARTELEQRLLKQKEAPEETPIWANEEHIKKALPLLLPEQQNDVHKIENHFFESEKNGILVTNGTGTGKTYTALGVVKRLVNAGKKNILIVTLNDKIARDFIKSGKTLGLDIYKLDGIKDNGKGHSVVITTYHNLSANYALVERPWDAIFTDEAHALMQSADGKITNALKALRALSGHHAGFYEWAKRKFPDKDPDNRPASEDYKQNRRAWERFLLEYREAWEKRWAEQKDLTKVVALSATPFSYVKTIDWAEGFLFHYKDPKNQYDSEANQSYNTGDARQRFFQSTFGFRMRYNRLTTPSNTAHAGYAEREFNENLKTTGALIGRQIQVKHDYDRKFVLIDSSVGKLIDDGLSTLKRYSYKHINHQNGSVLNRDENHLSVYISKRFSYQKRRQLLEAIKAKLAIPYIKKHLALGRKVCIFHDYNEGGGFSPFYLSPQEQEDNNLVEVYAKFAKENPDLVNLNLNFDSAVETLKAGLHKVLFFSGRISKQHRQKNVDLFNTDNSGYDVLVLQSDAGSTGISLHDTTGTHQRVLVNIGQPLKPAQFSQTEGRTFRVGLASNAIYRYLTTGTDWEETAFIETIAGRAETVDNLAKGRLAKVSIKEAIIDAYLDAEPDEPHESDGTGGKATDAERERNLQLTPYEQALSYYHTKAESRNSHLYEGATDWFPTPEPLGLQMLKLAGIHEGDKVLEPSAGDGALMRFAPEGIDLTMIEASEKLSNRAKMANTEANVLNSTFEDHGTNNKYHTVVMNPPFGKAGSLAIEHLKKAFSHLYKNGRIVALIPCGSMDKKLEKWLNEEKEAFFVLRVLLPQCTFEKAGTGVVTQLVVIDRLNNPTGHIYGATAHKTVNLTDKHDISALFESITDHSEMITMCRKREPRIDEQLKSYGLLIEPDQSQYLITGEGLNNAIIEDLVFSCSYGSQYVEGGIKQPYNESERILKKLLEYEHAQDTQLKLDEV